MLSVRRNGDTPHVGICGQGHCRSTQGGYAKHRARVWIFRLCLTQEINEVTVRREVDTPYSLWRCGEHGYIAFGSHLQQTQLILSGIPADICNVVPIWA